MIKVILLLISLILPINSITLTNNNFVYLKGSVSSKSVNHWNHQLLKINTTKPILFISSNGGSVLAGMNFIQTIKSLQHQGKEITCIADVALSMGFVILQYCDKRLVTYSSILMQHQMSLGIEGDLENVLNYLDYLKQVRKIIDKDQALKIGLTLDKFQSKTEHDWWLIGNRALKEKVADEMVTYNCDEKLVNEKEIDRIETIFGNIRIEFSRCPLIRNPLKVSFTQVKDKKELKKELNNHLNILKNKKF